MLLVSLLGVATLGASCDRKNEPDIAFCVYQGEGHGHCIPVRPNKKEYDREIEVGDFFMSREDVSKSLDHHEDLHLRLDNAKKK